MPRIRYIKPDFFTDEDLGDLPFETRITFAGLWCHADKSGRLEDRPRYLKAMIFPYDKIDIEKQFIKLETAKLNGSCFIHRYEADGKKYIQITNWEKHQKPHHTEKESEIPPPQTPPIGKEKGMGKEKQDEASTELKNGKVTVKEPLKINFSEFILLTDKEYDTLVRDYGEENVKMMIEELDNYIGAMPKKRNKYTDHNRVLRGWVAEKLNLKSKGDSEDAVFRRFRERHQKDL